MQCRPGIRPSPHTESWIDNALFSGWLGSVLCGCAGFRELGRGVFRFTPAKCIDAAEALGLDGRCLRWMAVAAAEGEVQVLVKHLRRVAALLAVIMASGLLAGPMSAQAQSVLRVQVGGFLGSSGAPADGTRFYGGNLRVHDGTTVRFTLAGFHTATLMPANVDGNQWASQNAGGIDKPFSLASSDPDDSAYKFNNQTIFPSDPTCGTAANPCDYDGSTVVNSGAFVDSPRFSATIDGSPGDVTNVICLIHPKMRMRIEVVPGGDPETTQEQIDAREMRARARTRSRPRPCIASSRSASPSMSPAMAGWCGTPSPDTTQTDLRCSPTTPISW